MLCNNLILLCLLCESFLTDQYICVPLVKIVNCSVLKMQKINTKTKMAPTPSTRTEEAEDGESHHPCRKSTLIYSLVAQPTEEEDTARGGVPHSLVVNTRGSCKRSNNRSKIHRIHHIPQCLVNIYYIYYT